MPPKPGHPSANRSKSERNQTYRTTPGEAFADKGTECRNRKNVNRRRQEFPNVEPKRSGNPQHYLSMNQASNCTVASAHELSVPAESGGSRGNAAASPGVSGTLGSLRSIVRERHFRTLIELWLLEAVLFSFAILRQMGYQ